MSDDLPPFSCRSRRLDTVDFEPILAALKPLSEVARWLAATGAPELVFQFTDRWMGLENVLAAADLTANTAWTYDDTEKEHSRRRHEAWDYLRGLLLDVPTKYAPQDAAHHTRLVTLLAVAVEMSQGLRSERSHCWRGGQSSRDWRTHSGAMFQPLWSQ